MEYDLDPEDVNPYRYCGEYFDQETGTVYLRARDYDPVTSRMLSPDPYWHPRNMIYGSNPVQMPHGAIISNTHAIWQSGNLYVYALNNPIRYIDPTGLKIVYKTNHYGQKATDAQIYYYERAIEYLCDLSPKFKTLYSFLKSSEQVIYINFNNQMSDSYDPESYYGTRVIHWDPFAGANYDGSGNNVVSPALALAHEMGHAEQHISGLFAGKTNTQIEANNLTRWEIPIATELGEYVRSSYGGGRMYRVGTSTDWGIMRGALWWKWFENKNTWQPTTTKLPWEKIK